jgi:hypothetical protein
MMQSEEMRSPKEHSANLRRMLTEIIDHARQDVEEVSEPKAQALFETIAETLTGLRKACQDYEDTNELAWRKAS